jgi:prepilin-type N-terminal cleavage/methylation domain-containing protein
MKRITEQRTRSGQAGFNLIEMVVSMTLLVTAGAMGAPPLANFLHRSRVEGAAYEMSSLLRASRAIAITRGAPAVVSLDPATGELVAFADLHGPTLGDEPDGVFNPIAGRPERMTDYEIGRVQLPNGVFFTAPEGTTGPESVEGFNNPGALPDDNAIFLEDGSLEAPGAFRLADGRGNYLEVIAAPRTATRIEVLKWDGSYWLSRGQNGLGWDWN